MSSNIKTKQQISSDWLATTGVSVVLNKPTIPDQVVITGLNGSTVSGIYPNIVVDSPLQPVITGAGGSVVSGVYPNLTITSPDDTLANNGTSKIGQNVQLGNDLNLTTAMLLSHREIPSSGFSLFMSDNGKFGIERQSGQRPQASLHIGTTVLNNGGGSRTIIFAETIDSSKYVQDNCLVGGNDNLANSQHASILNGEGVKVRQTDVATLTAGANNSVHAVSGACSNVIILDAVRSVSMGAFTEPSATVNSTIQGKYNSGLFTTTNGWILGQTIQPYYHNGDNNAIIGGHDNLIGGSLALNLTNPFNPIATPSLLTTEADNYADDSIILGSQFSQITDTGNSVIISGEQNKIKGAVRSTIISADKSKILATTRNTSGGQMLIASSLSSELKDCNYTSLISVSDTVIDGSSGVKDRSVAIAGKGLKIGRTDQLVHGTFNLGLLNTTYEQGIGTSDTNRKNGIVHRTNGLFGMSTFATPPTGELLGDFYFDTMLNRPRFFNGTTWITL